MRPCSSCHGGGGLAPQADAGSNPAPPSHPTMGRGTGDIAGAAPSPLQPRGCTKVARGSQGLAGCAMPWCRGCLPTHLWGTHPALLAHIGDWRLPRDVPSVLSTQGAAHQPHLSAHPHTLQDVHVHHSHSTPCPKGSPGPSALTTCPSCRKGTYSSSRRRKTPHIPAMLFPHPPHHHQPSLQTHWLLPFAHICCGAARNAWHSSKNVFKKPLEKISSPQSHKSLNDFSRGCSPGTAWQHLTSGFPTLQDTTATKPHFLSQPLTGASPGVLRLAG